MWRNLKLKQNRFGLNILNKVYQRLFNFFILYLYRYKIIKSIHKKYICVSYSSSIFMDINREYIMYNNSIKVTANKKFDIKIIDL